MSAHKKNSLISWINRLFLPVRHNSYRPLLIRIKVVGWFLALLVVLQLSAWIFDFQILSSKTPDNSAQEEVSILESTNDLRQEAGIAPLSINPQLSAAAKSKAEHMLEQQYWAHTSPRGVEPWEFIDEQGYGYALAGENLARGFTEGGSIVEAWQSSDSHRENQMRQDFEDIGIGSASGELFGKRTFVVVAMYAKPANGISVINQSSGKRQIKISNSASEFVGLPTSTAINIRNPLNSLNNLSVFGALALGLLCLMILIHLLQDMVTRTRNIQWRTKKHQHPWFRILLLSAIAIILLGLSSGSI